MRSPRRLAAFAAASAAAALLAACGAGAQAPASPTSLAGASPSIVTDSPLTATPTGLPSSAPIAQTRGDDGIVGLIYRVERRDGMVTVWAGALNTGTKSFFASAWTDEGTGYTLAGSSIIDRKGGKRYLALKDTKGNCLCTEIKRIIDPGETRPLFASFQAPPESTTEVDLQLGNMQPVKITIPAE